MAISRSTPTKAATTASRNYLANLNQGPADKSTAAAVARLAAAGTPSRTQVGTYQGANNTQLPLYTNNRALVQGNQAGNIASIAQRLSTQSPATPAYRPPAAASSGSGGRGGGGGGGGGVAAPQMSQDMINWIASLLKSGAPQAQTAGVLDLPDYQQQAYRDFDPSMFNTLRTSLGQATTQDQATIDKSRADMLAFLSNNYRNAFANADVSGGPMMGASGADLGRLAADQGVTSNPQYAGVQAEGQRAQQMAGDWRQAMAGNEDIMQRARIGNANTTADQNSLALQALSRAGLLNVGMQEGQARSTWQQAADQWNEAQRQTAYNTQLQESTQNWQRQNQVQDANTQNTMAYRNQVLQAMLNLASSNVGNSGISLPTLQSLGLG